MAPLTKKVVRHPKASANGTTISGATATPKLIPTIVEDTPNDDSLDGNQRDTTAELFGKAPASPAPKRKRATMSDEKPIATPVNAVKTDHHITIRIKAAL